MKLTLTYASEITINNENRNKRSNWNKSIKINLQSGNGKRIREKADVQHFYF
jgi:hypothetical protein